MLIDCEDGDGNCETGGRCLLEVGRIEGDLTVVSGEDRRLHRGEKGEVWWMQSWTGAENARGIGEVMDVDGDQR